MSRVTMQDLYSDLSDGVNEEIYDKVAEIEIVPRKIVEDIITACGADFWNLYSSTDTKSEAGKIYRLAKELLRNFEEGKEHHTCRDCTRLRCVDIKNCLYTCFYTDHYNNKWESCEHWKGESDEQTDNKSNH